MFLNSAHHAVPAGWFYLESGGMTGITTALHPEKTSGVLLSEKSKLDALFNMNPATRHELIQAYFPAALLADAVKRIYGNAFWRNFRSQWKRGILDIPWLGTVAFQMDYLHIWHTVSGLLIELLSSIPSDKINQEGGASQFRLSPAFELLGHKYFTRITALEAASVCSMGVSSFRKKFIELTGESFGVFELNHRFSRALDDRLPVKEAAAKYGFYDDSHFLRLFKRKTVVPHESAAIPFVEGFFPGGRKKSRNRP